MANNTGTAQSRLSYTDAYGVAQSLPDIDVAPAYGLGGISVSGIDVVEGTPADTEYSVAFSDVEQATYLQVLNNAGQEIYARIGGSSAVGTLVAGEATIAFPEVAGERLTYVLGDDHGGNPGDFLVLERDGGDVVVTSYRAGSTDVDGVLVLGTATITLPALAGERLSLDLGDDNGGTPGDDLALRRSGDDVIVTSYDSGGVATADVSSFTLHRDVTGVQTADVSDVTISNNAPLALPNGGLVSIALPTIPITGAAVGRVTLTLTDLQTDPGVIATAVLGDPV